MSYGIGVDFILDIIAGDYVQCNYDAAAMYGTIVQIGVQQGVSQVNFFSMLDKRLTHLGATLRSQSPEAKANVMKALQDKVFPLMADNTLKPLLYQAFPMSQAKDAHDLLDKGKHVGKLALQMQE